MFTVILNILEQIEQIVPESEWNTRINEDALKEILNANSVTNPELFILYRWRNGNVCCTVGENLEFCSWGYILPIDIATTIYNKKEFLGFKKDGFFPFISDFTGDYLLLKTDSPEQPVYIYSPSLFIVRPEAIFDNLRTFLLAIYECYLSNAYFINDNKLEVDMDLENKIFNRCSRLYGVWSENN